MKSDRTLLEPWIIFCVYKRMRVTNHTNMSAQAKAQLKRELMQQFNLAQVLKWAQSHPEGIFISSVVAEVIVQDEFTRDVIIPYRGTWYLVYDTT